MQMSRLKGPKENDGFVECGEFGKNGRYDEILPRRLTTLISLSNSELAKWDKERDGFGEFGQKWQILEDFATT